MEKRRIYSNNLGITMYRKYYSGSVFAAARCVSVELTVESVILNERFGNPLFMIMTSEKIAYFLATTYFQIFN